MVNRRMVEPIESFLLVTIFSFVLVRNVLQNKYPQLSINQPLIPMDFGSGTLNALMNGGRLFDAHKNLPSKGKSLLHS